MRFTVFLTLAGAALGGVVEREADADIEVKRQDVGPDPSQVWMRDFTYGGSGCKSGSVASSISDDRLTLTLIFDSYLASIGPGTNVADRRKNCQLNVGLHYPNGWTYTMLSATYRGFVGLDAGVTGYQSTTYYFSGETPQSSTGTTWAGPYLNPNYEVVDVAHSRSQVWSPCGTNANLNINSQISLTSTNANASGLITDDSIDAKMIQVLHLQWYPCPSGTPTPAAQPQQQQQQQH